MSLHEEIEGATITRAAELADRLVTVLNLFIESHKITADALKLALAGKQAEAQKLIDPNSRYASLAAELSRAMMEWAEAVK
jgi:hypothetical protein